MITFSALINIIFFSAIAIVLLKYVFKNNNAVLRLDIRFLLICMLLILLRLFIPIESPITNNIPVCHIYPDIYMFLKRPMIEAWGIGISILTILKYIWFIGAAVALVRLILSYRSIKKHVGSFDKLNDPNVLMILEKISAEHKRAVNFRLVTSEAVYTPFVFGIWKPYIVIPAITFTEEELRFVLRHEVLHYYRGDMLIKIFCEGLKAIYWWNPFIYMLGKLVSDMQEINVDFNIIKKLPELQQLDYSECLVKVAKTREKQKIESQWLIAFQKESPPAVHKRISLMLENLEISKQKTAASIMLSIIILSLIVLCPNVLIFEPYSISEEDADGSFSTKECELFYIENEDGTYSLYVDGKNSITVSEIVDEENIPVYSSIEEASKNK